MRFLSAPPVGRDRLLRWAGPGGCGGVEVLGGVGVLEGLAGEAAQVGGLEGVGVVERAGCVLGAETSGGGDQGEALGGVGGVWLEPAAQDGASGRGRGVFVGRGSGWWWRVAVAHGRDEAHGDDGVLVEDAEVGFVLGVVALGIGYVGVEDGAIAVAFEQRAGGADEGGRGCAGVVEGVGDEDGGDATPVVAVGDEDGGDDVLVEFDGEDGIEVGVVAERGELQLDGAGHGDVSALEVLAGRTDGGERGGAGAVVVDAQLAGEGLWGGDAVVDGDELDGPHTGAYGDDGRRGWGAWRRGGRRAAVALG